jgi:hypothetical protein
VRSFKLQIAENSEETAEEEKSKKFNKGLKTDPADWGILESTDINLEIDWTGFLVKCPCGCGHEFHMQARALQDGNVEVKSPLPITERQVNKEKRAASRASA